MVSIHSKEEDDFIKSLLQTETDDFWIGLNDKSSEGDFQWSDGSDFNYYQLEGRKNMNNGAGNGEQDCVQLWQSDNFQWDDDHCNTKQKYICGAPGRYYLLLFS